MRAQILSIRIRWQRWPTRAVITVLSIVSNFTRKKICFVTYMHCNRVVLYRIDAAGNPKVVQSLENPQANLSHPQHAVFSPDGGKMIVANWTNQTLNIYRRENGGLFCGAPDIVVPTHSRLRHHRPHGIVCSPDGNYLAIAYGCTSSCGRGIALFRIAEGAECELVDLLEAIPGIPKGITFSPDGTCLLVTFSDIDSLVIYDLAKENSTILPTPRQILQGHETQISRPEDVKISSDGSYCAICNSDKHTVTFYPYDAISNRITQSTPSYILQNPQANLHFPHGIAFSPDGDFMLVTEFGPVSTDQSGAIILGKAIKPSHAKVRVYNVRDFSPK